MRKLIFMPLLAVMLVLPAASRAEVIDGVRAVVNDKVITYAEV